MRSQAERLAELWHNTIKSEIEQDKGVVYKMWDWEQIPEPIKNAHIRAAQTVIDCVRLAEGLK